MYRCIFSIRHARHSSAATSLFPLFTEKLSFRCFGGSGGPRSSIFDHNSLSSNKSFTGKSQNQGHVKADSGPGLDFLEKFKGSASSPRSSSFQNLTHSIGQRDTRMNSRSMDFVKDIIDQEGKDIMGRSQFSRHNMEQDADFVHIKMLRNNTFVTVTDSKGNVKLGASSGCLKEKGGAKVSRYAAQATAEHVGRKAREYGVKSVVMKVKGFTFFKKKRQAIMSFKEGFAGSRGGSSSIVYVEDTTRRPHNGCRLPKRRRT
ncbi:Ribosomal protein S11 [Quillaja saponaria]|uniref:Ribosomal protein S11 n=1 Tax=Quillaja saponaria TaxID=32244 RepID=A0AAD7QJ43_QUISA|nr:Ribosomal protein S11 [Quillaja saponaria]